MSGVQPSGELSIGNYLGALRPITTNAKMTMIANTALLITCTITVRQDPKALHEATLDALAICLAVGVDPKSAWFSPRTGHAQRLGI